MANKITKEVKKIQADKKDGRVTNFMGNDSFRPDPLTALRMAAASSIFGEPQYYRNGANGKEAYLTRKQETPSWLIPYLIDNGGIDKKDSATYMEELIDNALDYDFNGVLDFAAELRNDYLARLNPQVIMVRAALHPKRNAFNEEHPGKFREIETKVMSRADEPAVQASYYLYLNEGQKNKIPSILKRSWADCLNSLTAYEINKYKNAEIGMIDTVRICHANSPFINELMKNGSVKVKENEKTWENLRSEGKSWKEILDTINIPHMALLRNLRGIADELEYNDENRKYMADLLSKLEKGVLKGKQYPFRYWQAYKHLNGCHFKPLLQASLSRCMKIALDNMPDIKGKVMVLTDNSGSAWGTIPSEYGSVTIAEIDNLSAVLTAMKADEGYIGVFGDRLEVTAVNKESSIMDIMEKVSNAGRKIGGSTENGVWLFWKNAIEKQEHWDNVFIYSDMQAGYSGLYGIHSHDYVSFVMSYEGNYKGKNNYINVVQLVEIYRKNVFDKVNVFSVQTAGYDNSVLPQTMYRTAILYGWTGKETVYADKIIKEWSKFD